MQGLYLGLLESNSVGLSLLYLFTCLRSLRATALLLKTVNYWYKEEELGLPFKWGDFHSPNWWCSWIHPYNWPYYWWGMSRGSIRVYLSLLSGGLRVPTPNLVILKPILPMEKKESLHPIRFWCRDYSTFI